MFFANLSLLEFLTLFTTVSAATLALYLLIRSRRRMTVSTLRFWRAAEQPVKRERRRRIEQPWSLFLQLLGIALLLLAIAQPKWGSRQDPRNHVVILDASAWSAARNQRGSVIDQARAQALSWLKAVPAEDKVMLIRAAGEPSPATRFTANREDVAAAIRATAPHDTPLSLRDALTLARQAQALEDGTPGEIVFAGSTRTAQGAAPDSSELPKNLRALAIDIAPENLAITRVLARPSPRERGAWSVSVVVRNDGRRTRTVPAGAAFGDSPIGVQNLVIEPGAQRNAEFSFQTEAAGILEARLGTRDVLDLDDRVRLELPALKPLRVQVFSANPDLWRPLLAADARIDGQALPTAAYRPNAEADLLVLHNFQPPAAPQRPSLWVDPPAAASPIPVARSAEKISIAAWRSEHPLAAGLRGRDRRLDSTLILRPATNDLVIAEAPEGPVIVARPAEPRLLVIGFNPLAPSLRYDLALPVLFANTLDWVAPRVREVVAGAGGAPLAQAGDLTWDIPSSVVRGVPRQFTSSAAPRDLWKWFALLGLLCLAAEWWLYGRDRARRLTAPLPATTREAA